MANQIDRCDHLSGIEASTLLYGENRWQSPASHFRDMGAQPDPLAIHNFEFLVGTPSFVNITDIDRLLQTITHAAAAFDLNTGSVPLIAVAVKHGNACGAAVGNDPAVVLKKMIDGDTRAIMGGLVMTNFPLDPELAELLVTFHMPTKPDSSERVHRLLDGVIAPDVAKPSVEILQRKADKCRIMANRALGHLTQKSLDTAPLRRQVRGGYLLEPNYTYVADLSKATGLLPDRPAPTLVRSARDDLLLAWAICATSTSNTITIVNNGMLLGNGVGQQDRVGAAKLAIYRARMSGNDDMLEDAVAASDSFFPFPDGVVALARAGIKTILTTSGSIRDADVGTRAAELGVAILAHPDKEARGFYNH